MRSGDALVALDGRGAAWDAQIREVGRDAAVIELLGRGSCAPDPAVHVTLFAAVLKGDRQDWLVQKAVELGVSRIQPIVCERSVVKPGGGEKADRWQRIAQEAAEQCERGIVPEVAVPIALADASWQDATALVCTERRGQPLLAALPRADRMAVFIGPEGGWGDEEVVWLEGRGAIPVSLGPRILRAETAALAALAGVLLSRSAE